MARELSPDIVIMDVTMPGLNGIEAARKLAKVRKAARIIALSMHNDRKYVTEIFKVGARALSSQRLRFRGAYGRH